MTRILSRNQETELAVLLSLEKEAKMSSHTVLRGYVGSAPEAITKKESDDQLGSRFRLAVSDSYRDREGNWVERDPQWFSVKCWGRLGVNVYHSVKKGDPIVVVGKVGAEEWVDTATGQVRTSLSLVASAVGLDLNHCMTFKTRSFEQQLESALEDRELTGKQKTVAELEAAVASDSFEVVEGLEHLDEAVQGAPF
ncbi:hypothetical protein BSR29_02740 [Boudabousia liubingyangii]|uniref:Single-stranded DNA-binding protein n=1 Tax=Boudabousia liubingyangii TaxID=1921764 RepID=A0A1Q5PMN4_9ACTO|nr:single-stranded DNA-binding protein [Boudabousia liubingyangii]OKL47421.1 hypothetical protein BSR28_02600 [Boudabousia liubingyangii]OKL48792.1 hypothetical protein BSR29_02740 [Boudabousia liubingyangii]